MNSTLISIVQSLEIKTDRKSLQTFGYGLGVILLIFAGFQFWFRDNINLWLPSVAVASWLITWVFYKAVLIIYYPWMIIAKLLGIGITYIVLTLTFYLILLPIGSIMRLSGKDLLKSKWNNESYWEDREQSHDKRMNRMF